jgi:predicted AAA+ superfamily ATPase
MIPRKAATICREFSSRYPVVAILGPRQSGKTTLAKEVFSDYTYVSLEELDIREFATTDPRGFLANYEKGKGIILDEIQHVPSLLSYIQTRVDEQQRPGAFVITGSHNFLIHQAVSQTLAGRVALLKLLPLSIDELENQLLLPDQLDDLIYSGFYPRIYAHHLPPAEWYQQYLRAYVEKDVRSIKNVPDLLTFLRFIKLCAGRIGQLLNLSSLSTDCGIDHRTAKGWISLLEASYIIFTLSPYHANFGKRLIKMPKIYFYDVGLACSLLGITSPKEVSTHYLRGGLFESMILADFMKQLCNTGKEPRLYFWRDQHGHEVDCILEQCGTVVPIEIKSSQTILKDSFDGLGYWARLAGIHSADGAVVYAGEERQNRSQGRVVGWKECSTILL